MREEARALPTMGTVLAHRCLDRQSAFEVHYLKLLREQNLTLHRPAANSG
jgi:hypothetical protein